MSLIFAGTPDFADTALAALLAAGHDVKLVLTRPDRAAGRGQQLQASPVKRRALAAGIAVFQPRTLRDAEAQQVLAQVGADWMVVAAYGLILPAAVLTLPRHGCLNIHASLLPRWRGAAPIQRAIEAGDRETGITIMQMDEGLDTGAMLLAGRLAIGPTDPASVIHDRLAELGASLIVQALADGQAGRLTPVAQPAEGVTYATKLAKSEAVIDWSLPADRLANRVRAFDPVPGNSAWLADRRLAGAAPMPLKIWQAEAVPWPAPAAVPGAVRVADGQMLVACGSGALRLLTLQKPGGRRLPVADFLRGFASAGGLMSEYCQFVPPPDDKGGSA